LETAIEVTLTDCKVMLIPTTAKGPLYHENSRIGGLLLGRSSSGIQGLIIVPGVTDVDYTGIIQIMAYTLCPLMTIPQGSKIAQIIALEQQIVSKKEHWEGEEKPRGADGFGSTGHAVLFTQTLIDRPRQRIILSNGPVRFSISPLLDTGADVTIIN
ncbi:hypothetical protein N331_06201, partial [Merops nubicus]